MTQRVTDQPAFLLHRRPFSESSLILDILSRDHGRLSLMAKAARKRRDVAHFQVGRVLRLGWSGRGELKNLQAIDSHPVDIPGRHALVVFYLNELLLYLLPAQDSHPELFDAYQSTLLQLAAGPLESLLRQFELDLLISLGMMPDLAVEADSGRAIDPHLWYRVLPQVGVLRASDDHKDALSGALLMAVNTRRFDQPEWRAGSKRLMRAIIDFNLQGRALQSRKLYQQMIQSSHEQ